MTKHIDVKPYYYKFHDDIALNFQLNRVQTNSGCSVIELMDLARKIDDYSDVTPVCLDYYKLAHDESRMIDALFYLRLAEFFCLTDHDMKKKLYEDFRTFFYEIFDEDAFIRHEVPYEDGALAVLECLPKTILYKDTIVFHGGGDSFIEEFYTNVQKLCEQGYRVIMFEGPGQGQPLYKYDLKMTHEWEKPVSAILDWFKLADVTLMGISLGGYFALRAAAFEKRISKVILWGVVYDFFECIYGRNGMVSYYFMNLLLMFKAKKLINNIAKKQINKKPEMKWIHEHSLFVHGVGSTYDFMKKLKKYTTKNISKKISQDVIIMVGEDDHIIPSRMYERQMRALTNASSIKGRVFTKAEHASSHCQVGNIGIAIAEITDWIETMNK